MAQGILLDHTALLEIVFDDEGNCIINYGFHTFHKFSINDTLSLRVSIIQLLTMGVKKSRLSKLFHVHRKTLENWQKEYERNGLSGLISIEDGRPSKCDETAERYIVDLNSRLKQQRGHRKIIIDEIKRLFGISISRELIRRVLSKRSDGEEEDRENDSDNCDTIDNNAEEREIKNGGVLLSLPLLAKHKIEELIPEIKEKTRGYSFKDIALTISMLLTGGLLKNEEQVKMNDSACMGGIIGKKVLASLRTIRRMIPELIERVDIKKAKRDFALHFYKLYITKEIFYIDGHFMPYYGKEKILYGYNSLRRIAMKGRTSYVVNSESGRPIFQILSENFDHFTDNILKMIKFLKKLGCGKDMMLVFDRGGFGEDFFTGIYQQAKFICWYKGKALPPGRGEWKKAYRHIEGNVYGEKEKELLEVKEGKLETGSGQQDKYLYRILFIKKGEKISVAITNDLDRPCDELAIILTRRWGAQENVFKELKKIGYDNIHSYWKEEYSSGILLENGIDIKKEMMNPEYKAAIEERNKLKKQLKKLLAEIGKVSLSGNGADKRAKARMRQEARIDDIKKQIEAIDDRINYLPEKILRLDYVKENGILKLGNDKKEYFDLMKFISYNVRRDIADIIGPVYLNNRDIHAIIVKWLQSKCILQKVNDEMIVTLSRPGNKNEYNALQVLCDQLNLLNYKHFNTNDIMRFRVA